MPPFCVDRADAVVRPRGSGGGKALVNGVATIAPMNISPSAQAPSWSSVVLVCKECQKRGSGPKRLKAKALVQEARSACKAERPRPRIVVSGCLGLCPKRAIAVARVGPEGARIVAAAAAEDVARVMPSPSPAPPLA